MNGRWWWNDPDQIIVRSPLDDAESRAAFASAIVSGGPWILGDDLNELADQRLQLLLDPSLDSLRGLRTSFESPLLWVSGFDIGPVVEAVQKNDMVPTRWELSNGDVVLLNLTEDSITIDGPGGTNLFTGESTEPGPRVLDGYDAEIWR